MMLQSSYESLSFETKLLASLGHNSAMGFAFNLAILAEANGPGIYEKILAVPECIHKKMFVFLGIQWGDMFERINPDDSLLMGHVIGMFLFDGLLYLFIALYVEQLFPGDFGVPQPWYFPFTKSFWCGNKADCK